MRKFKIGLTTQIVIAVIVGVVLGAVLNTAANQIKFIGEIFLKLIQMSITLLVMGAVIESLGELNPNEMGKIGKKTFFGFLISTFIAAFFGLVTALLFKPGTGLDLASFANQKQVVIDNKGWSDVIKDFVPSNIFQALAEGKTVQVILFAIIFGYALSRVRTVNSKNKVLDVVKSVNEVTISVLKIIMKTAPVGIGALLASIVGSMGVQIIFPMLKYLLILGLGSLLLLVFGILVTSAYCKVNPWLLTKKLGNMSAIAVTTTSSAVTLPSEMVDAENKIGVGQKVSRLVLPLAMSLNSAGTGFFLTFSIVTIVQIFSMQINMVNLVQYIFLSILACLGTTIAPGGGIVALSVVVPALGLPLESIAILGSVDWFTGMYRTVLNVDGDVLLAMIISKSENELKYDIFNSENAKNIKTISQ